MNYMERLVIWCCILAVMLSGCVTTQAADPHGRAVYEAAYEEFYEDFPESLAVTVHYGRLDDGILGMCEPWNTRIVIDLRQIKRYKEDPKLVLYHELAHCGLGLSHDYNHESIMGVGAPQGRKVTDQRLELLRKDHRDTCTGVRQNLMEDIIGAPPGTGWLKHASCDNLPQQQE
jgi:hypothetical protein